MNMSVSELIEQRGLCFQNIDNLNSKVKKYKSLNIYSGIGSMNRIAIVRRCYAAYQLELMQIESQIESLTH